MAANATHISFLGTGEMGSMLIKHLLDAGHRVTAWNRTPEKVIPLVALGAEQATDLTTALGAGDVVILCLLDAASVRAALEPNAAILAGRSVINLTTTQPDESRDIAAWAARAGVNYLDGGIMAMPSMIGNPGALILYSGSATLFAEQQAVLDVWAESDYLGPDAGLAPLMDLAMLASMYAMIGGYMYGAAMVRSAGISATKFAERISTFLVPIVPTLLRDGPIIDGGDYTVAGQQALTLTIPALNSIVSAGDAVGIDTTLLRTVQGLVQHQIDQGFGSEGTARMVESLFPKA